MTDWLKSSNGVMTSSRDDGTGNPITDVSVSEYLTVTPFVLQSNSTAINVGSPFAIGSYSSVVLEIVGTLVGALNINFEVSSTSGAWYPITGTRITDNTTGTKTTSVNELWRFNISGLTEIRANITEIGAGSTVTVNGVARYF